MSNKVIFSLVVVTLTLAAGLIAWVVKTPVSGAQSLPVQAPTPQNCPPQLPAAPEPKPVAQVNKSIPRPKPKVHVNQKVVRPPSSNQQSITLNTGTPVLAYHLLDESAPPKRFVPIYNDNKEFGSVAVYKQDNAGSWRMTDITPLFPLWSTFPVVDLTRAQKQVSEYTQTKGLPAANYMGKMVVLSDDSLFFYHFQGGNNKGGNVTYLVDAFVGHVEMLNDNDLKQERLLEQANSVKEVNGSGHIIIRQEIFSQLPVEERNLLKAEVDFTNKMVDAGKLKFDENGNTVFDKRTEEDWRQLEKELDKLVPMVSKNYGDVRYN